MAEADDCVSVVNAETSSAVFWPEDPRTVMVQSMSFVVEGREDYTFDLSGDVSSLEDQSFIMKEGTAYNIRINFCVQREIASGLRLRITTARKGINVDKQSYMVGCYGPKGEVQTYLTPVAEAPSGMIARGSYKMTCSFLDDDKKMHLRWSFRMDVKKDWE
ncbi:ARHGDIA [Bugula neritina]|uniref:ARHGDIA n=1 Tax=Bugula neritina TaxID=10212 RepID=A0A7J7JA70_BUGNE|nr:ARHGDIA [Bugula neritina]